MAFVKSAVVTAIIVLAIVAIINRVDFLRKIAYPQS